MSVRYPDDAILPPMGRADSGPARVRLATIMPIAIALVGVAAILFGGLTARDPATAISKADTIDPVMTGSIAKPAQDKPDDIAHILEMLDK
jgi:hypothetical protein